MKLVENYLKLSNVRLVLRGESKSASKEEGKKKIKESSLQSF